MNTRPNALTIARQVLAAGLPARRAKVNPRPATTYRWFRRNVLRVHRADQLAAKRAARAST